MTSSDEIVALLAVALYLLLLELVRRLLVSALDAIDTPDSNDPDRDARRVVQIQLHRMEALRGMAREAALSCEQIKNRIDRPAVVVARGPQRAVVDP